MSCKASTGLDFSCADLLKVGGSAPTFWVSYLSELDTAISLAQTADIGTIDFGSYGGFRRFDGNKFSHSFGSELTVAAGGNKSYTHTFVGKVLSDSTTDDVTLQDLALGNDIFIMAQDNNRNFYILGAGNGLSVSANAQNTGQTGDSDTTVTITLTGAEKTLPLRFALAGGYQATLDYIEALEL